MFDQRHLTVHGGGLALVVVIGGIGTLTGCASGPSSNPLFAYASAAAPRFALQIQGPGSGARPLDRGDDEGPVAIAAGPAKLAPAGGRDVGARPMASAAPADGPSGGATGGGGSGGGSGGSGGVAPTPLPSAGPTPVPDPIDVVAVVRAGYPNGAEGPPIAGAVVRTLGSAQADHVADAEGRVGLEAYVPGTPLLVTAPGHVPSLVTDWRGEGALHLTTGHPLANRFESFTAVAGTVTAAGQPVAGAVVVGGNADGTSFGPLVTDASGRFAGRAIAYGGADATDVAAFAFARGADGRVTNLGLREGGAIGAGAAPMAIEMQATVGEATLALPEGVGPRVLAQVAAHAANGMAVPLLAWGPDEPLGTAPVFELPGVETVARVEVRSPDGAARSVWRERLVAGGRSEVALLPFPQAPALGAADLVEGRAIRWPATAGADGYRLTLRRTGDVLPLWEAYAGEPALVLAGLPADAADELEVVALRGGGARALAGAPDPAGEAPAGAAPAGPRFLRWFDPLVLARFASRVVPLSP